MRCVYPLLARIIASPALSPHVVDEVVAAASRAGRVLAAASDSDVSATCISFGLDDVEKIAAIAPVATVCAGTLSAGRAYRIDVQADAPEQIGDDAIRTLAVSLHGAFAAPVFSVRRQTPAAAWAFARPMPWGRKGLAVGQSAPALPFGGSECLGVSIEVGRPTVVLKARLDDVPEHGLVRACAAVGGAESGFADVGAYPAVSGADGASVVVLEFGDCKRSPLHRALTVLEVEAARFGGRLGQVSLLSHVPLEALLDVLSARTGLAATIAQVLETHLSGDARE